MALAETLRQQALDASTDDVLGPVAAKRRDPAAGEKNGAVGVDDNDRVGRGFENAGEKFG